MPRGKVEEVVDEGGGWVKVVVGLVVGGLVTGGGYSGGGLVAKQQQKRGDTCG